MIEIEVKAIVHDRVSLNKKLADLGCQLSTSVMQGDVIFLPLGIEYSEIVKGTPVVRIRNTNDGTITLTLKKRIMSENELVKLEKEIIVSDIQKAIEIVEHMGFHEVVRVEKGRMECKYEDMTICIDSVVGLGDFIEVERLSENGDEQKIQEHLFHFLQSLGIDSDSRVEKGYDTLMYEKNIKSGQYV